MSGREFQTGSPDQTRELGAQLGSLLAGGDLLALKGQLGSGKTVFVQGLARGLDIEPRILVTSPSFVILHEYPGKIPLYHFDFYRLQKEAEVSELGYEEYFDGDGVCAVEWAEKFPGLFGNTVIWIEFAYEGESRRRIILSPGPGLAERWPEMEKQLPGK